MHENVGLAYQSVLVSFCGTTADKMKMHSFCFECTCVCRVSAAVSAALRSDENISKMPSSQKWPTVVAMRLQNENK